MTKSQAIREFFNSFGVEAYVESTVPDKTIFTYITYQKVDGEEFIIGASVWDKSTSWKKVMDITDAIAKRLGEFNYITIPFDGGYYMLYQEEPFYQRMSDEDRTIRRIYLNIGGKRLARYQEGE